jgi:hypothetical protein
VTVNERCLRCGRGWTRGADQERHPCPECGEPLWDTEFPLDNLVGVGLEYGVYEEAVGPHLILTLGLRWTQNRNNNTRVPLSHRLKETYRHAKGDLAVKDGRELVVSFEKLNGRWVLHVKRDPHALSRNPFGGLDYPPP